MKDKIKSIFVMIVIMVGGITFLSFHYGIEEKEITNDSLLSIMLEDEEGKYVKAKENTWSEEYILNEEKSYCTNNSKLSYNEETKKVSLTTKGSEKCWLYFDKEITGTEDNPYKIATIEDLVDLSNEVNQGNNYASKYIILTKNLDFKNREDYENPDRIDYGNINGVNGVETLYNELNNLDGSGFIPIGTFNVPFQGIFDGREHTIQNIYIKPLSHKAIGLFGGIKNSTIKNLNVEGKYIQNFDDEIAGIVACIIDSVIDNCVSNVNVSSVATNNSIGGLVSFSDNNSTIKNSINKGSVTALNTPQVGGIIGCMSARGKKLVIDNCSNEGTIISNRGFVTGGIIGRDSGTSGSILTITNSYNKGNINIGDNNVAIWSIGGIIGLVNNDAKIEDTYNSGNIISNIEAYQNYTQNIYGGLVGRKQNVGKLLINKGLNEGNIEIAGNSFTSTYMGGLIGDVYGDNKNGTFAYVLNSYNLGDLNDSGSSSVKYSRKGGIISEIYMAAITYILNSYNAGNITGYDIGLGTILDNSNEAINNINLNNVFNLGTINCPRSYEIYMPLINTEGKMATMDVKNTYYMEGANATNRSDITFNAKSKTQMMSQEFVEELNKNIVNINLEQIDSNLKDYTLIPWKLGDDNIPTFAEIIPDLSGKGNDGLNFGATLSEEGITTGKDHYIKSGLAGYDFKNSASLIVKVKISEFTTNDHQRMFNNYGPPGLSSGIGIAYANNKIPYISFWGQDLNNWRHNSARTTLDANKWYTIVGTYDGNIERVYVNGINQGEMTFTDNIKISTAPFYIGRSLGSTADYTLATYAEALIFDRALTEEEIKNNYAGEINPINKNNLLLWYKF